MEKNRETRRASFLGSNGFKRRRHRNSPDEDGRVELQESIRLRDRVKKDRDLRERHSRIRRRIADDETSEESFNDDEDDEDEENVPPSAGRLFPPPSGSVSNHQHPQHRKSFPPGFSSTSSSSKIHRASPVWKPGDEIISCSIPRKARSASTKRLHDWNSSSSNNINGGGGSEQIFRQPSSSPTSQSGVVSTSTPSPADPMSPPSSSSNYFFNKKLKTNGNNTGSNPKPPKSAPSKQSSSNREELELEIAEVLYGLKIQSQGPSSDSKESNRSKSPPICNSGPVHTVAPKSKRPRQAVENSGHDARPVEMGQAPKGVISSPSPEKISGENGFGSGANLVNSQEQTAACQPAEPVVAGEKKESRDLVGMKEKESCVVKNEDKSCIDSSSTATAFSSVSKIKAKSKVSEVEIHREQKFEIDLMAPPPQARSSPKKAAPLGPTNPSTDFDAETKPVVTKDEENDEEKRSNSAAEESEEKLEAKKVDDNVMKINLQLDLGKAKNEIKSQQQKPGQPKSSSALPSTMASWPGALPPMGTYMAPPLQGVVSMDGPTATSPIQPLFTQPRPKRCATHSYIARNIHCMQQIMKMNPFWQAAVPPASLFGSKPSCNPIVVPTDLVGKGGLINNAHDKGLNSDASNPNESVKDKNSQNVTSTDSAQRKQQILMQQALPTVAPSNLLGPAFIFPYQQQAAVAAGAAASAKPNSTKPHVTTDVSASSNPSSSAGASTTAMSFNYPPMSANETQYLAILQNNGYPIPIQPVGPPPNYRGPPAQAMPFFNGSFYPSQMIHPSQIQHHQQTQPLTQPSQKNVPGQQQSRPQSSSGPGKSQQSSQQSLPSNNNQHRQLSRPCREDSPTTTTDSSRGSRPPVNMYGPNFAMPIHPQNIAMMTNQNEKRPQQQQQQFGLPLGAINGPGIDVASMAQNHGMFQNFPEATRQNIQNMMAAAAAAAQAAHMNNMNYKNNRISEDDKSGAGDTSTNGAERKNLSNQNGFRKQSIESSSKAPDATAQTLRPVMNNTEGAMNVMNAHHHIQGKLQQQLKQQQQQMAINWSKTQVTNNGHAFPDHLKTNFPQNLVQSNNISPSQSPQWRNTSRTPISQAPSSLASSTTLKNHNARPATQTHNQISFGANPKPPTTTNSQGQAPMSPTNSSVSKGSSRTTSSNSTNTKTGQGPIIPAQQPKNTPSILGNPNAAKTQMQQQLFFSNPYSQVQSPHSTSTSSITSGPNGYYMQRGRPDQNRHPGPLNSSSTNDPARAFAAATGNVKGGGLPSQGIVHAAQKGGPAGGTFLPAGFSYAQKVGPAGGNFLPADFSYVHPVPSAAQVKPAEQKQPAGNANLHAWQQLEKK